MELTKEIILNLKDSGKDICIYSEELIKNGFAYRCFCTQEQIDKKRKKRALCRQFIFI